MLNEDYRERLTARRDCRIREIDRTFNSLRCSHLILCSLNCSVNKGLVELLFGVVLPYIDYVKIDGLNLTYDKLRINDQRRSIRSGN